MDTVVAFPASLARTPLMTARGSLAETEVAAVRRMITNYAMAEHDGTDTARNVIDFTLYRWAARRADASGPTGAACRSGRRRRAIAAIAAAAERPLATRIAGVGGAAEVIGQSAPLSAA